MFDFDCQMRFWQSATEAAFGYASATMAAASVMQDHVQSQMTGEKPQTSAPAVLPFNGFNPFALPFQWWSMPQAGNPFAPVAHTATTDFISAFFPFAPQAFASTPAAQTWNPFSALGMPAAGMPAFSFFDPSNFLASTHFSNQLFDSSWSTQWVEMMRSFGWIVPQPSWTMWQHPMTAALMSAGMPYSVASPTARANASAMDAADAARDGFNKAFSNYHSDGGYAAAHSVPKPADVPADFISMMMAPWMVFAPNPPPG